jgi:exopolysaccharide biosynthesis polyprenyl glycosylphosphotransferase
MLREHSKSLAVLIRLFDLLALAAAWPLAHAALRALGGAPPGPPYPEPPLLGGLAVLFTWSGASSIFGLYGSQRRGSLLLELEALGKAVGATVLVGLASAAAWPGGAAASPRLGLALFAASFLILAGSRLTVRQAAHAIRRRGYNSRYFTVVGSGAPAEALAREVVRHPHWGYAFLGFVREPGAAPEPSGAPVLGRLEELSRLLSDQVIDEVFFVVAHGQLERIESAVKLCQEQGVVVHISLSGFAEAGSRLTVVESGGRAMLTLSSTPPGGAGLVAKRALDLVASAIMLLLLAPLLAMVAVAIRRDSPGPVLFRQRRVGLNGREFTFFKFRSMRVGAEGELARLQALNEMDGPVFKMRKDPRITAVGHFLRRSSIDELPQFWNVLRGEMSLVGPRPPLPGEVRQYKPWQRRRLSVKPGITCTWQVSGRNEIDFDQWMRLDLSYIDGWSFWGDVGICLQTIPAVLFARGAR